MLASALSAADPDDSDGDSIYEVCVRAFNNLGQTLDQLFTIEVPPPKVVTGVTFTQEDGKNILVVQGTEFLSTESEYIDGLLRSLVTLNGEELGMCVEGSGFTAEILISYGANPEYLSETQPCYYVILGGSEVALTATEAKIWLPADFDTDAFGTVLVNGSNTFPFNIVTNVSVDGDKPIDEMPTIPERPTFSGMATPPRPSHSFQ